MEYRITLPMLERFGFSRESKCTVCILGRYVKLSMLNDFNISPEDLKNNTYNVILAEDVVKKTATTLNHVGMRDKDCSFIFSQESDGNRTGEGNTVSG